LPEEIDRKKPSSKRKHRAKENESMQQTMSEKKRKNRKEKNTEGEEKT
jgi:hypothetical protein